MPTPTGDQADHTQPGLLGFGEPLRQTLDHSRMGRLIDQAAKVTSRRPGGRAPRGYLRSTLEPVWRRLGIARGAPGKPGEPGQPGAVQPPMTGLTGLTGFTGLKETPNQPGGTNGQHGPQKFCPGDYTDQTPGQTDRVKQALAKAKQNAAYRAGLCVDCRECSPSAGRPRCDECHHIHVNTMAGYDQ